MILDSQLDECRHCGRIVQRDLRPGGSTMGSGVWSAWYHAHTRRSSCQINPCAAPKHEEAA